MNQLRAIICCAQLDLIDVETVEHGNVFEGDIEHLSPQYSLSQHPALCRSRDCALSRARSLCAGEFLHPVKRAVSG